MKIVLIGYGKMGKTIERLATQQGHEVVGKIDIDSTESERREILKVGEVAIEFSHPEAAFDNIVQALNVDLPIVSGTTGWLKRYDEVKSLVDKRKGKFFYASNFSIGVNIMFALNEKLAEIMNRYKAYDISVDEIHHVYKKDEPSGTALTLTNKILENVDRKDRWSLTDSGDSTVKINAYRQGTVFGTHKVSYQSDIDTIELFHNAHTRDGFALGAITAANWLVTQQRHGVFTMKEMMGL